MSDSNPDAPRPVNKRRNTVIVLLTALLAAIAMIGATAAAVSAPPTPTVQDAKKSLALAYIKWEIEGFSVPLPSGDSEVPLKLESTCTAWFADSVGHMGTARHCLDSERAKQELELMYDFYRSLNQPREEGSPNPPFMMNEPELPEVDLPDPTLTLMVMQSTRVEGTVIKKPTKAYPVDVPQFDTNDHALMKVDGLADTPALQVADRAPEDHTAIWALGYPGTFLNVPDDYGRPDSPDSNLLEELDPDRLSVSSKGGSVNATHWTDEGVTFREVDTDFAGGMSGGPVVDEQGRVVGVISAIAEMQSFNIMTDTDNLRSFLARNGISPTTDPAQSEEDREVTETAAATQEQPAQNTPVQTDGMPYWAVVLIAVATLFIGVLIGWLSFGTRKRRATSPAEDTQDPITTGTQTEHGTTRRPATAVEQPVPDNTPTGPIEQSSTRHRWYSLRRRVPTT